MNESALSQAIWLAPKPAETGPALRRRRAAIEGPDPIDKHVGAQLRQRRSLLGLTQTELGQKLGLTFQSVQKYETGENRISASRLYQLARVLDAPISYFFAGLAGHESGGTETQADLPRQEAEAVLKAYYGIEDEGLRSAYLTIMAKAAEKRR